MWRAKSDILRAVRGGHAGHARSLTKSACTCDGVTKLFVHESSKPEKLLFSICDQPAGQCAKGTLNERLCLT
jgi:hypothetical protein